MIGETTYQVTARLQDGKASMRVTAVTPYGNRTVSVAKDIDDPKMLDSVKQLFTEAVGSSSEELGREAFKEAARAVTVALGNDEDLDSSRTAVAEGDES